MDALALFRGDWFLRNEQMPALTDAEQALVRAALGPVPQRWDGSPDVARMAAILADRPRTLEHIGSHLLTVLVRTRGCGDAVRLLLSRGVALEFDETAYNALHEAAWADAVDTLEAVFESGVANATCVAAKKPHTGWPDNLSLMYWAAWGGYPQLARLLLRYGRRHSPRTAHQRQRRARRHVAARSGCALRRPKGDGRRGQLEVARILIRDGARYDIYAACGLNDIDRLTTLIEADPSAANTREDYGMTPLHWAARAGSMACLEALLEHGAEVDARNKAQRTPVQLAAEHDRADAIEALAKHGADLNTRDRKGRTPLHRAAYEGKAAAAAEALLAAGADAKATNKNGKTAFDVARMDAKYLKARA